MISHIRGTKKYNKLVNITKKDQIHRYREQTSLSMGRGKGRGLRELTGTNYYV